MTQSESQPNRVGPHIFKGIRTTRAKNYITSVQNFVNVYESPAYPERMVAYFGSGQVHPLSAHEGEWVYVGDLLNE